CLKFPYDKLDANDKSNSCGRLGLVINSYAFFEILLGSFSSMTISNNLTFNPAFTSSAAIWLPIVPAPSTVAFLIVILIPPIIFYNILCTYVYINAESPVIALPLTNALTSCVPSYVYIASASAKKRAISSSQLKYHYHHEPHGPWLLTL